MHPFRLYASRCIAELRAHDNLRQFRRFLQIFLQSFLACLVLVVRALEAVRKVGMHIIRAVHNRVRVFGHNQLFIGGDNEHFYLAVVRADAGLAVG